MKPNEIYSAADVYLSGRSPDSSLEDIYYQHVRPSETKVQKPADDQEDPVFDLLMKYDESTFIEEASTSEQSSHTLANDAAKIMSTSTSSPPRICNKNFTLPKSEIELQFSNVLVKLGEIINPCNFYLVFDENDDKYQDLKQKMKEFYEKNPYPLPICSEHLYATKLENTQEWERVKIVSNVDKFYCCYFVDKGVTNFIPDEKLFLLDDQFKLLPPRSTKASLFGFNNTKWSAQSINLFKILAAKSTLNALITEVVDGIAQTLLVSDTANINEEMKKFINAEVSTN